MDTKTLDRMVDYSASNPQVLDRLSLYLRRIDNPSEERLRERGFGEVIDISGYSIPDLREFCGLDRIKPKSCRKTLKHPPLPPIPSFDDSPDMEAISGYDKAEPAQNYDNLNPKKLLIVRQTLAQILNMKLEDVRVETNLINDAAADELDLVEVYQELEERLGIEIRECDDDAPHKDLIVVGGLVRYAEKAKKRRWKKTGYVLPLPQKAEQAAPEPEEKIDLSEETDSLSA